MSPQPSTVEEKSLGEYLREVRINLGLDLAEVAGATKISAKSLQAIEENDFAALPAEAFARGFYALYAKCLSLNPEEILLRYTKERPKDQKGLSSMMLPTGKVAEEVGNLAERPAFMTSSFIGLLILLLLLFGGVLCWYFSWNPATFLSQKLRSLEDPIRIEQLTQSRPQPATTDSTFRFAVLQKTLHKHQNFFDLSYPSTATAADYPDKPKVHLPLPGHLSKHSITAEFTEKTRINLKIDNQPERSILYTTGDTITWRANKKAVITLPIQSRTKLTFNDTPLDLPATGTGLITLHLPQHL